MKLILLLAAITIAAPNPKLTPGQARPLTVKQICGTKWGKDQRHVTEKMKKQVCAEYHAKDCPGPGWEIDHWISRELGGADTTANLWAQPQPQAHWKDLAENYLHRQVCSGKMSLKQAQENVRDHWYSIYLTQFKENK